MPAIYAGNSDFILIPDDVSNSETHTLPYHDLVEAKKINLIHKINLPKIVPYINKVIPWGWDAAINHTLEENGIPSSLLKNKEEIENIRRLSHRRIVIPFRKRVAEILGESPKYLPKELFETSQVEEYLDVHPKAFFKAPWSSSGRGIVVSDHISRKGLLEWAHGIIRRQGSILVEPAWSRSLDFASEWIIENGEAEFIGYSVFETSSRGKYHGNIRASQETLSDMIRLNAPKFSPDLIKAQTLALKEIIVPYYEGPLGIDMLADTSGSINPCVEINLRLTMGLILLDFQKKD